MEISSSLPLYTSPSLMSGFQSRLCSWRKVMWRCCGLTLLHWFDLSGCNKYKGCTNVASVRPGVVQSHIARSPRNYQIRWKNKNSLLWSSLCVSLKPNPIFSVVCPPHTQSPAEMELHTGEFHLHTNTHGCITWHVLLQRPLEPPGAAAGNRFPACVLVLLPLGGATYMFINKTTIINPLKTFWKHWSVMCRHVCCDVEWWPLTRLMTMWRICPLSSSCRYVGLTAKILQDCKCFQR